ncbi:MAG: hypothetical protein II992_06675 [Lachnospiraceae bacterium]|nr:hypothetical protein [Lachnospiraceae bacterium]
MTEASKIKLDKIFDIDSEYPIIEREVLPEKIVCPDCGGITYEGLELCHRCGGLLI